MVDKFRSFYFKAWRPTVVVGVLAAIAYFVFLHKLGTLLPGYSSTEAATLASASHFRDIVANPLNAPYKLLVYLGIYFGHHGLLVTRIAAAIFAIGATTLIFLVLRAWFTYRVALLGTILFATSSALMHIARLGSPLILQMSPLVILAAGLGFIRFRQRTLMFYVVIAVAMTLLYVPGLVWFELAGLALWRRDISPGFKQLVWWHKLLGGLLALAFLAPLVRAFVLFPSQLYTFFGLPQHLPSIATIGENALHTVSSVVLRSNGSPELWLGHAPLLGVIQSALLLAGIYTFTRHFRLSRSLFMLFGIVISLVLISLGGPVSIGMLVPYLYLLIAGGLYELLHEWLSVFPRNPIARFAGVTIVCTLVFFSVLYQWRSYFVAWPHNDKTRATFHIKA